MGVHTAVEPGPYKTTCCLLTYIYIYIYIYIHSRSPISTLFRYSFLHADLPLLQRRCLKPINLFRILLLGATNRLLGIAGVPLPPLLRQCCLLLFALTGLQSSSNRGHSRRDLGNICWGSPAAATIAAATAAAAATGAVATALCWAFYSDERPRESKRLRHFVP